VEQEGQPEAPLSSQALASPREQGATREVDRGGMERASWLASCFAGLSMVLEGSQNTVYRQGDILCCFSATFQASADDTLGHTDRNRSLDEEKEREEGT
jgi:hypothetical protein